MAYVNMSQSGATCPQGLTQRTLSGLTLCGRMDGDFTVITTHGGGCQSTVFSTLGSNYSRVCGQLRGYQLGSPDAFFPYFFNPSLTIDNLYVDGAPITYGSSPRKHIWTYANSVNLMFHGNPRYICPCKCCNTGSGLVPPSYVGSDYYCETGDNDDTCCNPNFLFSNDPLWDGQQCFTEDAPCCTHPKMPWFNKTLSEITTENIELRVCGDMNAVDEDTPLQVIELFVREL